METIRPAASGAMEASPYGPSLSAIAGEHFAVVTGVEGSARDADEEPAPSLPGEQEPSWEERLTGLEAGLSRLQQSLDRFVSGAGKATLPRERGEARGSAVPGAPGLGAPKLPGLDPAVVAAARQAGIPEEQLAKMSQLVTIGGGAAPGKGAPKAKTFARTAALNLLDESEAEEENEQTAAVAEGGPMAQAVIQMSKILTAMQKDRSNDLENLLDRADGGGGEAVSGAGGSRSKSAAYLKLKALLRASPEQISASIESLMAEDFAQVQSGPRQQGCLCSARGWVEHRSHLQQFAGPIRQAWLLAGMVDAINAGSPEQAKAMAPPRKPPKKAKGEGKGKGDKTES